MKQKERLVERGEEERERERGVRFADHDNPYLELNFHVDNFVKFSILVWKLIKSFFLSSFLISQEFRTQACATCILISIFLVLRHYFISFSF